MVYVPGFTPLLQNSPVPVQPALMGGPARMDFANLAASRGVQAPTNVPAGIRPSAPAIMQQPAMQATIQPTAMQPTAMQATAAPVAAQTTSANPIQFLSKQDFYDMVEGEKQTMLPELFGSPRGQRGFSLPQPTYDGEGLVFRDNKGVTADFVDALPDRQYRLVDNTGGGLVFAGTGHDALRNIYGQANQLSSTGGKKANWQVEYFNPNTNKWEIAAKDRPDSNVLGTIADIGLPVLGAIALPGVGGVLGGALGAGLGAAGGSALSSVAQGRSLTDTLLRAGLSGVAAGGLSAIGGAPFIPGGAPASGVGGALGGSLAAAGPAAQAGANFVGLGIPEILVQGGAGALGAGAAGALAGSALGGAAVNAVNGSVGNTNQQNPFRNEQGDLVLTGTATPPPVVPPIVPPIVPPVSTPSTPTAPSGEIVVTGQRPGDFAVEDPLSMPLPPIANVPTTANGTQGGDQPTDVDGDGLDLDDIIRYLRAGSLGIGLIGSLFGGGRQQQNGFIPAGFGGGLNPVFGGGLPAATIPGASNNFAQRPANYDWYRYGYGPGQSFFDYAPQGQANTSQAYTGYAEGGLTMGDDAMRDAYAVEGPGTGRSDEIPALLSDGEYVIDAETVALLGDGSTRAGADRLDQFRVNVRKHKGSRLAKGDFSPDAKQPEQYFHGGRA